MAAFLFSRPQQANPLPDHGQLPDTPDRDYLPGRYACYDSQDADPSFSESEEDSLSLIIVWDPKPLQY
ncbi:uncharacterized protein ANIA_11393 [Aspergillus nidulans FGSC A4]|uniref:Uncharacterized protein n=1 Tax=Emericella nidulans (strain FGSC A4 / ATCC 38163 / CBS 112.46 / NRRL 194 / M139) TaxID=227321 RepID=C8VHM8_EMENI|nr:hypothetical protein [Aspergillus nidulans FGSC A4]CBF82797.1 TPA: hypothetical protein ANIA_11393 [Aspergillus nidulans FGSC A4]